MVANEPLFIFVANTCNVRYRRNVRFVKQDIGKCSGVVIPLTTDDNNNTFLFLSEDKYVCFHPLSYARLPFIEFIIC
jgi:hypothetical protein